MNKLESNLSLINDSGDNIKKLANELKDNIEQIYDSITNMENNELWIGSEHSMSAVKQYIEKRNSEKKDYVDFASNIYKLGDIISDNSKELQGIINNNKQ